MIPHLIHFAWFGPPMPQWARDNIEQFRRLNPDWEVFVHGEDVLLPEYDEIYAQITDPCTRSDLLAFSILQRYGGWVFDCDYWPFRGVTDIVRAFDVDGLRMFVTEQHGQMAKHLRIANGILAARPDWKGWRVIQDEVHAMRPPYQRCDFGPVLMTRLVDNRPDLFCVGGWPFFYPAEIGRAVRLYKRCKTDPDVARRIAPTGGQKPFVLHLWAGGKCELNPGRDPGLIATLEGRAGAPYSGLTAVCAFLQIQWDDLSQPFQGIADGLARIGFDVEVRPPKDDIDIDLASLVVLWNGRADLYQSTVQKARSLGIPVLRVEHGFFDRRRHVQMDLQGILTWASWANDWGRPAPVDGAERLMHTWGRPLVPFASRRKGYVLVLGQVPGDSQMDESEIKQPTPLERCVAQWAEGKHVPAFLRPHPLAPARDRYFLPVLNGGTLQEAVAGARFVVTINSNAGNEALALGCPVACVGPALYANAGVALQSKMVDMPATLDRMAAGWTPDAARVRNYLEWLAARQYSQADLRQGDSFQQILGSVHFQGR